MASRKHKFVICSLIMSLGLTTFISTSNVQAASVNRKGGGDRFSTARAVAEETFSSAENVILVYGFGFPDAVSATPLAKQLNAPILLTQGQTLEPELAQTISRLGARNVYIVGGEGVVKPAVKSALEARGLKVTRLAKAGGDRFDTNAIVAKEVLKKSGQKKAILVNGKAGYADALSVASIAAKLGYPVLITDSSAINSEVKKVVYDNNLDVLAVGGKAVVPDSVVNAVSGRRIAEGANRFDTNIKVMNYFKNNGQLQFDKMFVASGGNDSVKNFADALVASAAAAKFGAPVVLSGLGASSSQVTNANEFISDNILKDTDVTIVGAEGVFTKNIENQIIDIAAEMDDDFKVIGIE